MKRDDDLLKDVDTEALFRSLILRLGDDPDRKELSLTPLAAANAWQAFFQAGNSSIFSTPALVANKDAWVADDKMITLPALRFLSFRDVDLMPFWGAINTGYYPKDNHLINADSLLNVVRATTSRIQSANRLATQLCEQVAACSTQCIVSVTAMMHIMHHRGVAEPVSDCFTVLETAVSEGDRSRRTMIENLTGRPAQQEDNNSHEGPNWYY